MSSTTCARCGRELSDPESVQAGYGPICRRIIEGERARELHQENQGWGRLDTPLTDGVAMQRINGIACTNIHQIAWRHSLGPEWGYGGSGPAELALNICEIYGRRLAHEGYQLGPLENVRNGRTVHAEIRKIYQDFKAEFLCDIDEAGGFIPQAEISAWLRARLPNQPKLM